MSKMNSEYESEVPATEKITFTVLLGFLVGGHTISRFYSFKSIFVKTNIC